METRSKRIESKIKLKHKEDSTEEEEDQDEDQEEGSEKDSWEDEDEKGSELDKDTLLDLGYAVSNLSTINKPVTLNTRSPIKKLPPTLRLDTPSVCHPLLPEAA